MSVLCCILSWVSAPKTYLHIFPHRIFMNVLLQFFIAPPIYWSLSHRSIELPYFYSQAWKDSSHGPLLHRCVCWLPCLSISIGCLLCSLSSGPLTIRVLVDSKVRGPTWLPGGGVGVSHDFCGFLQIMAVFIKPCWSTLSKTHSNPHIHYYSLFH